MKQDIMVIKKDIEKEIFDYLIKADSFWVDLYPFIEKSEYSYSQFYDVLTELMKEKLITLKNGGNISHLKLTVKGKLFNKNELIFRLSTENKSRLRNDGILKPLKRDEKKWYNEPWIGNLAIIFSLVFAVYQYVGKSVLKSDNEILRKQLDSLEIEFSTLNTLYLNLLNNVEKQKELEKQDKLKNGI